MPWEGSSCSLGNLSQCAADINGCLCFCACALRQRHAAADEQNLSQDTQMLRRQTPVRQMQSTTQCQSALAARLQHSTRVAKADLCWRWLPRCEGGRRRA